jgi:hypothetical protein
MSEFRSARRPRVKSRHLYLTLVLILCFPHTRALGYAQYSQNGDATNCRACHGSFRATSYISLVDGANWGNLHNLHRTTMLNGDCDTCHGGGDFPVMLAASAGGNGLSPISCMGCHGRAEDQNLPASGYGAGLRQHHFTAGVTVCLNCHGDSNPANYTPVAESVLPPYYANPGVGHPLMPTASCNGNGSENFAGTAIGLDNDGNDLYDMADPACNPTGVNEWIASDAGRVSLSRIYPNPSSAGVSIEYRVAGPALAELRIFDVHGRVVRHLGFSAAPSSVHRVEWDGKDDTGAEMPSGVYLCDLRSGEARSTATLRLVR